MTLAASHLSYRHSRNFSLADISIEFSTSVTALIGPNGAGKSTLVRCLANQLNYRGSISYNGVHISSRDIVFWGRTVGFLPQNVRCESSLTVFEVVLLGLTADLSLKITQKQIDAVEQALTALELKSLAHRPLCKLSGGQQQMVLLAQTLCKQPSVLLLDEPLNSLDIHKQFTFLETLMRKATAPLMQVIIVLHDLQLAARYADRVAVLAQGRLHSYGPPREVITEHMLFEVFGVDARVRPGVSGDPAIEFLGPALYSNAPCLSEFP
ncbi:ABC transporter ATP-binding protein [Desulfobacter curvatus]|uniref:ABC transporter ATP-binding protein n=1 Tax=Desulfobacter curvatus TaxID=2290 RepID=UPI00035D1E42|nr:ABC transporter ATP-binding protein [Desulfobacter curvatus]